MTSFKTTWECNLCQDPVKCDEGKEWFQLDLHIRHYHMKALIEDFRKNKMVRVGELENG